MTFGRRTGRLRALVLVALVAVLMGVPSLPSATGRLVAATTAASSSTVPVDAAAVYSGSFATRAGYDSGYARSVSDAVPAADAQLVVVTFRPTDPSFFAPTSGARALSVTEIADRYGLSPAAYASAESYFESMGLTTAHTSPDRLSLTLDGTPSAIDRAFGTELESGTYEGRAVTFPSSPPGLPAGIESSVAAVTGLSSGFVTFSLPAGLPGGTASASKSPASGSDELISPEIARQVYDLSSLYNVSGAPRFATGQGIALLLWGDGYDPDDLRTFFSSDYPSSFPQPTIAPFPVDGAPSPATNATNDPSKAPQELTLDVEWAGSMAPGATIDAVYAPDGPGGQNNYSPSVASMTDALNLAVTGIPGVSVISMSFGTPEGSSQPLSAAWATDLATATQEGITLLAATGDLGGDVGPSCMGGTTTDYPADSTEVIAVGGTAPTLARNLLGQITGLASEPAWSGSGGGFSSTTTAPSWQEVGSAAAPIRANGHRGVPDVAASSAYDFLYYAGQNSVAAGTSFATPLWAGLITEMDALYGSKLGFLTPRLYAVGAAQESGKDAVGLADVTSGSTCMGSATQGWDPETGWGSPRALLLYEDLTATFVHLAVSVTPSPVAPGGTVTMVAQLSNRTSGAVIAGVPIEIILQASDPNGPCAGVWNSGSLESNATGSVSVAVTVPVCFLGAHGTAQVSVTSDGYYGTNSTTFEVNLLGFVPALVGIEQFPWDVVAFVLIMGTAAAIGFVLGRGRVRPPHPASPKGPGPAAAGRPPAAAPPANPASAVPPPAPSRPPGPPGPPPS